jgi:4-amino-4-deoxychorismate lyase
MPRFIETIKLLDGQLYNLSYHQQRVDTTIQSFNLDRFKLESELQLLNFPDKGLFKLRIIYGNIAPIYEITPYIFRTIQTLKLVDGNDIDYQFKHENRDDLHNLYQQKQNADDIIILKQGFVTDSYFANLVFKKGNNWFTPEHPLLKGTQRSCLIDKGIVKPILIRVNDLGKFEKVKLINSMMGFNCPEIEIDKIIF